jgi:hypothetical protein
MASDALSAIVDRTEAANQHGYAATGRMHMARS